MRINRILLLGAVGLVVTVGLAGPTAVATGTSGANVSEAWQGTVTIQCGQRFARGRFTLSVVRSRNGSRWRVISDRGRCVDRDGPSGPRDIRTLFGAKGTIWMTVGPVPGTDPDEVDSVQYWRISTGTRAYAGLRGRGKATVHRELAFRDITMKGIVSR
jgi:hypothetical protein